MNKYLYHLKRDEFDDFVSSYCGRTPRKYTTLAPYILDVNEPKRSDGLYCLRCLRALRNLYGDEFVTSRGLELIEALKTGPRFNEEY